MNVILLLYICVLLTPLQLHVGFFLLQSMTTMLYLQVCYYNLNLSKYVTGSTKHVKLKRKLIDFLI